MSLLNSKKGQVHNYVTVIIVLFLFAFLTIISLVIYQGFTTSLTATGMYTGQAQETGTKFWNAFLLYDKLIVLFMALLVVGVGLTSYRLATAPAFFIISFLMGFFLGAISLFFNYMFVQIVGQAAVQSVLVYFPLTMIVCTNFHWIALVVWTVGSITLYAKRDRGGQIDAI